MNTDRKIMVKLTLQFLQLQPLGQGAASTNQRLEFFCKQIGIPTLENHIDLRKLKLY